MKLSSRLIYQPKNLTYLLICCLFSNMQIFSQTSATATSAIPSSVQCPVSITSFSPASGPENTMITILGSGFTDVATVTIGGVPAIFAATSDTELITLVPQGGVSGTITVTAPGCSATTPGSFTILSSSCMGDVYISEVYDALTGTPGAIELYNPTPNPINLTGYTLLRYGDIGIGPPSYTMNLTGTIPANDTFIVAVAISDPLNGCPGIPTDFPLENGINQNDEFELLKNGVLIDNLEIPLGTGSTTGRGYTLIRKPDAIAPEAQFNVADWFVYGDEFCSNLDMHTANPVSLPAPEATGPATQYICENGSASFTVTTAGTGNTYQWMRYNGSAWVAITNGGNFSGATTATLSVTNAPFSLHNSQYYCIITTTSNCTLISDAAQLNITQSPAPVTADVVHAGCGSATGSITITSPLDFLNSFSINGTTYQFGTTFTGLAPGTYNVTAKNISGCISSVVQITINNVTPPAAPVATIAQPTCASPTGAITVTSPTGTGLQYSIGGAYQTSPVFGGLVPDDYTITVQNADGCTSAPTTVTVNPVPNAPDAATATITQPTCTTPTGTITVDSPTGTGLQYSIGGGYQTSPIFSGLSPDDYTITVQNTDGCISAPTTITVNPVPASPAAAIATLTQPTCTTATGTITVDSPTGTGLQYSIGGAYQNSNVFTGLTPDNYTITVQDADGCISDPTTVTINAAPNTPAAAVATVTQPTCTSSTGTITIDSPTGTALQYSIGGTYQSSTIFTGLTPNDYTITVQNADGCISAPVTVTVNPAPVTPPAAVATLTQPTCASPTGTITIDSPTGAGLQYSIGGTYQSSNVFSVLTPNDYTISVQNAAGCVSAPVTVTINPVPNGPDAPVATVTQPDCFTAKGIVTIDSPIGTGLQYSIGGAYQSSTIFSGLNPNNYTITVQNADGCISASSTVTVNPAPNTPTTPTASVTQPTCTTSTGTITVDTPTGTGLQYSIGGAYQTSNVFTGLNPNDYNVTVQNAAGCVSAPITVTVNAAPAIPAAAVATVTQPTCTTTTGTITIDSPTGTGLLYSIGGAYQSSTIFSGLNPNNYAITVQNADGCISAPTTVTVNPVPVTAQPTYTITPLGCNDSTGTITFTSPAISGTLYSINNGIDYFATPVFNNVAPGNYNLVVQTDQGCISAPIAVIVNPAPAIPSAPTVSATQPSCGSPYGTITVNQPTGSGYTYSKDGVTYQTSTFFGNLTAGNYSIWVKNAAGCTSATAASVTINASPPVPQQAGYTLTQPNCTTNTGAINITSPTGSGLQYSIDDGVTYSTTTYYPNLSPGSYQLIVKNGAGCTSATVNVTINTIPNIPDDAVAQAVSPLCGGTNGSITVSYPIAAGLQYSIDGTNYQYATTFTAVAPGNYNVYVRNAAGCIAANATPVTVSPAPQTPPAATATVTNPDCATAAGSISVLTPTGTGLEYSIDNGTTYQTSPDFANLIPGNYTIRVRNVEGCVSAPVTKTVQPQPALPPVPVAATLQPDCSTRFGKISVSTPLNPGYTYSIDNGVTFQANPTFFNVAPGDYTLIAKNAAGCTEVSDIITINNPPAPAPSPGVISGTDLICANEDTQLSSTEPDGVWSSSNEFVAVVDVNGLVTALTSGTVTISYTVGTVCTATSNYTVNIKPIPEPQLQSNYWMCQDNDTGEISPVILDSGLPQSGNTFTWTKDGIDTGIHSSLIIVSEPGNYALEVTSASGCTGYSETTVGISSPAVATAVVETDFQYRQTITVNVRGGSGDYEFSLNGGAFQDENIFNDITEGLYSIIVNDKNGCGLIELEVYALDYPRFFSPNGDGTHETWNIKGLANQNDAIIYIFDRFGKVLKSFRPGGIGWDGTYNGALMPATDYWFTLFYTSSNGKASEFKAHFSLLR